MRPVECSPDRGTSQKQYRRNNTKYPVHAVLYIAMLLMASTVLYGQSCTTATCTSASASESAVLAALPSPSNTNATVVVNIPAGTSNWAAGFSYTIPSGVTTLNIVGATSVSCTGTAGTSSYVCSASDSTNIVDTYASNNSFMTFTVGSGKTLDISGLTMKGGTLGGGNSKYNGYIQILSGSGNVRFHGNHCNMTTYSPAYANASECFRSFAGLTESVADHNLLNLTNDNTSIEAGISDFGPYNDTIGMGDGNFASPTPWGSVTGVQYVESNYFAGGAPNDCGGGASQVMRYNTILNSYVGVQTHGTKSPAGPTRGCRSIEAYHNYFALDTTVCPSCTPASALVGTKGATALMWGNIVSGQPAYHFYQGGGDRQSGDETETNTPQGWGYCGTAVNGNGVGSAWDGNNPSTSTGYPCLDGLGRGQDVQALNGLPFCGNSSCTVGGPGRLNSVTGTIAWSHQYLEPQYLWNNTLGTISTANYMLLNDGSTNNKDYYYDQTAQSGSFTGAAGTGNGLLSARPSTCTKGAGGTYLTSPTGSYGVGYWGTDTNTFYVCDGSPANHWAAIYTPAVYPHPLVSGGTTYSLTVTATNGLVTGSNCATNPAISAGTTIGACSATANTGYTFSGWSGTGSASSVSGTSPVSFALNANSTLTATMTVNSYTVTTSTTGTGSGTVTGCGGSTAFGSTVTCTANVTSGAFTGWSGGVCSGTTNPCVFTMPASAVTVTAGFSSQAATPTFAPPAGTYGPTQNVVISSTTTGATICYTTNGATPASSAPGVCAAGSTQYVSPVSVATSLTIKAVATKSGNSDSAVGSAAYVINGAVADPTFSPTPGPYGASQSVTLATTTSSAAICYTTDGSTPTASAGSCTHGTLYTGAITVSTTQTIQAIGTKSGFSNSNVTSGTYTINGTLPTPTFAPAGGGYAGTQSVTISVAGGGSSVVMVNSMQETANASDSIGSSVHRNTYTNCATGYSGGQLQPAGQPVGTLYCTSADKTAAVAAGGPNNGVVTSTISGTGTTALDNGNGAGGNDSPTSVTATYAGATGTDCGAHGSSASSYISGLTFPDPGASAQLVMGINTGSPGNTSILTVSKYNSSGDSGRYVARRDCFKPNSLTVGGAHYELDYNYNTTGGTYMGFGEDYDIPNKHWRAGPQSSPWIVEELCPVGGGACSSTYTIGTGNSVSVELYMHWNAGCTYSSGSACAFYDGICLEQFSGGSSTGAQQCYDVRNASTHAAIGFIPINKTTWTHPQYAIQHQWDINASSATLTATIDYSTAVAYYPVAGSATICYTTDGTTPTGNGAGTCTHGSVYSTPLTVSTTTTVKAIATQAGFTDSAVGSATYTINGAVANPTFSPVAGTYSSTQSVTISSATAGSTLCYTTDGSTPTTDGNGTCTHGTTYSTAVSVSVSQAVKAIGTKSGYSDSSIVTANYVITGVSAPTISGTVTLQGQVIIQ